MPELPQKKVGIVACSGEELAEGTVTRLAALKILEEMRPDDTVTICLPLFLAGGEGERAFARYYPTIAIDGCALRCAARATEEYSGKPAAGIVVSDIVAEAGLGQVSGLRRLNEAGQQAVLETANRAAEMVDHLLGKKWSRRQGTFAENAPIPLDVQQAHVATCACGSGIPVQTVQMNGRPLAIVALPAIFEQFRQSGRQPSPDTTEALLAQVKIYNPVSGEVEGAYRHMLNRVYTDFWGEKERAV